MTSTPEVCPKCSAQKIIPIVYGMPDADLVMQDAAGEAVIGGVATYEYSPEWHCAGCSHQWRTSAVVHNAETELNADEEQLLRSQLDLDNGKSD